MKHIKSFDIFESAGNADTEYELHIKNEFSKLKKGDGSGLIDLGEINTVSKTVISNLERTYPKCEIIINNDHYFLKVK